MISIDKYLKSRIRSYFSSGSVRSVTVKRNIAGSLFLKCISIIISFI